MHVGLEITLISQMTHPRANFTKYTKVIKPTRMTFCDFPESPMSFENVMLPTCALAHFNIHSSQPMTEDMSSFTRRFTIT